MMKPSTFNYYVNEAFRSLYKNGLMSLASGAIIASCVLILTLTYCVQINIGHTLKKMEKSIGITVFPKDDISVNEVSQIQKDIFKIPHVNAVEYVSPDDALKKLEDDENRWILAGLEKDNPLSHSYSVGVDEAKNQALVISEIEKINNVRKINSAQNVSDILITVENYIGFVGVAVFVVLAIISFFIVMNTIRLSFFTRSKEINIMKYIGATDWFIRWPFIIEGVVIGFFGSLIPIIFVWINYSATTKFVEEKFTVIKDLIGFVDVASVFPLLTLIGVFLGILIGVLGSVVSIHKFLKV